MVTPTTVPVKAGLASGAFVAMLACRVEFVAARFVERLGPLPTTTANACNVFRVDGARLALEPWMLT